MKNGEKTAVLTAASYARFSTKHQKDTSVDDQEALNERTAERFGYKIIRKYSDRAKSGRTRFGRDELDSLIEAIKRREFDALIIEDIDRITRDKEDLQHIIKRMKFANMKLILPHGEISDMEVDFKGIMSAEYIKNIVVKIKRSLDARVEKGLFPGAVTYGYSRVELVPAVHGPDGTELVPATYNPGVRIIDELQASVIRRIFTEYSYGVSPRIIAIGLTRDGILAPSGASQWSHQTIIGGSHGHGILSNPLYIGQIVWNTHATTKSPYTLRDVKQPRNASEHLVCAASHLRIIDQKLWDACQAIRSQRSQVRAGPNGRRINQGGVVSRSQHILSGLLRCSECNGSMRFKGKDREGHSRVICAAAYDHGSCGHSKSYGVEELKNAAFDHLQTMLQDQEVLSAACAEAAKHFEQMTKGNSAKRGEITGKLTNINVKIERAARAIVEGTSSPTLEKMLTEMEIERAGLVQRLNDIKDKNVSLHPNFVSKVLEATRDLHHLLGEGEDTPELRARFRSFVDHIDVIPTNKRMPVSIRTFGRLEAMLGADPFPPRRSNEQILEIEGLSRGSNGNTLLAVLPKEPQGRVICLGEWRQIRKVA